MKNLTPYLTFNGNCRQAIEFYKNTFKGEIVALMTFGDEQIDVPEEQKNKIMHSILKANNLNLMASDTMPEDSLKQGTNIHLSLDFDSEQEELDIWNSLSENAEITMPLQDTFWGAKFGILTDKFGINWMFNFDKPAK